MDLTNLLTLNHKLPDMPAQFGRRIGFIKAPLEELTSAMTKWNEELDFGPKVTHLPGGLKENAHHLLPLEGGAQLREILIATPSPWTAYFNSLQSGDISGPVRVMGRKLGVDGVIVSASAFQKEPGAIGQKLGGLTFEYRTQTFNRSIALIEGETSSSRYHFETGGPIQDWEQNEHYTNRYKRKRFTPEILQTYARHLGIDPFNLDYYNGPTTLIQRTKF